MDWTRSYFKNLSLKDLVVLEEGEAAVLAAAQARAVPDAAVVPAVPDAAVVPAVLDAAVVQVVLDAAVVQEDLEDPAPLAVVVDPGLSNSFYSREVLGKRRYGSAYEVKNETINY